MSTRSSTGTSTSTTSWVAGATGSAHDVDNLPYAAATWPGSATPRLVTRIGDHAVDLAAAGAGTRWADLLAAPGLDPLLAAGPEAWAGVRGWLTDLLTDEQAARDVVLLPVDDLVLHLPFTVGDFVDFYASEHHATNVGRIFRPDGDALLPNWRHLPVGYHGRSGSVVVSGTPVRRPCGQRKAPDEPLPSYGPSARLDIEAELGFVVGRGVPLGERVPTSGFADHVFGVVGVNDWSARDVQAWEYVPLGPHLGKSFATTVAGWVTPLAALEPARVPLPGQDPAVLPYLTESADWGLDVEIEVELAGEVVSRPPYRLMYWSPAQMLAHLTVNGASLRPGDLFASGTVSGPERDQRGSLLELSWGGREPFTAGGRERTFLEDGDEVVLRYSAPGAFGRIALGEVRGTILPALP
ncbi:fumarylacetoacetase [Nocardioides sp. SYSU D00038]|uniref:fumarylacetoacetase n=1 Tax=Nocardioides sp. SYSU D00038 TaxID=2812554 RepID=UPI001966D936|nr:fumarylacetoacetase [Nocardioides sp. SYSU D00038]